MEDQTYRSWYHTWSSSLLYICTVLQLQESFASYGCEICFKYLTIQSLETFCSKFHDSDEQIYSYFAGTVVGWTFFHAQAIKSRWGQDTLQHVLCAFCSTAVPRFREMLWLYSALRSSYSQASSGLVEQFAVPLLYQYLPQL